MQLAGIFPGIACVGYTFGLGSMAKLGAVGGWLTLGLIALAGVTFWALLEGSGRLASSTGGSVLRRWWSRGPLGVGVVWVVTVGLLGAQWTGLPILTQQLAGLLRVGIEQAWPAMPHAAAAAQVILAIGFAAFVACCLLRGARGRVLMILAGLTVVTGIGLAGALAFSVGAQPMFLPRAAPAGNSSLLGIPGIALAMPTLLLRPWLLGDRGGNGVAQRRDALAGGAMLVALCVMAWAVAWRTVPGGVRAEELVRHLHLSGHGLASAFLVVGAIGAGLTSVLPMIIAVPVWIADCRGLNADLLDGPSLVLVVAAAVIALAGLVIGDGLAGWHRVAGRAAQLLVPLLVVGGLWRELHRGGVAGERGGRGLNAAMGIAFLLAAAGSVASGQFFFSKD